MAEMCGVPRTLASSCSGQCDGGDNGFEEIHRRVSEEACDKGVGGTPVNFQRFRHLDDLAAAMHGVSAEIERALEPDAFDGNIDAHAFFRHVADDRQHVCTVGIDGNHARH